MRFDMVREEPDPSEIPPRLAELDRLDPAAAVQTRRFVLDLMDNHWMINGNSFDSARSDAAPGFGTTEIW